MAGFDQPVTPFYAYEDVDQHPGHDDEQGPEYLLEEISDFGFHAG
jgi:hypothetical protein